MQTTLKAIIQETKPMPTDPLWWYWRAKILAAEENKEVAPTNLNRRIYLRRN